MGEMRNGYTVLVEQPEGETGVIYTK